ncbi:SAGA complex subunit Sgf73 [Vermiconidia calcicola]|uniref:SAGA complex subunit Sgf73 n=1 Tax=Vermiconidia calcicola TaxID=1690605 RepID=A0ACC3MDU0_9PEZI|nr:SAGA complex subunit Sgf73 [Vermiconidia calcicola]
MGSAPAASVPKKPAKNNARMSIPLENLFDDMKDVPSPSSALGASEDLKKALSRVKKAGTWDSEGTNSKTTSARPSPGPGSMNKVPLSIAKAFPTSKPMSDKPETQKCNVCKRAVAKHAMPKHIESCLNKKQEKQRKKKEAKDARDAAARKEKNAVADSEDEEEVDGKKTTPGTKGGGLGASKKRKAGEEGEDAAGGPAKKKKKNDTSKAKPARPKAPVDVEKQCGVELPQGGQCARSLTCKSHSMGAKRAVPGRSAPYDKLLMEYQRKNQAKLQKAQFDANAPNPDDEDLPSGPVDSEEEKDAVMGAIARSWGGRPLYQHTMVPLRAKYQHNRIRGMLQSAFGNRSGGGGGGGLFSAGSSGGNGGGGGFFGGNNNNANSSATATAPVVDDNGIVHARRGSVIPGARSMMAPQARKPSVANASATVGA